MKKALLAILILATLLSLFGCSGGAEDEFHYDLINKYSVEKKSEYYIDTFGDVGIKDFGLMFNVEIFDVAPVKDNVLMYTYAYDGAIERQNGFANMNLYCRYLEESPDFEYAPEEKPFINYRINGTDKFITIGYYDMSNSQGVLVAIMIPTKGIVGEKTSYTNKKYTSSSSQASD